MNNFEILKKLIAESTLQNEEKTKLVDLVKKLSEKEFVELIEIFQKNPEFIQIFYKNFQLKKTFGSDASKMNKIIKKEEEILNNISEQSYEI